MLKNTAYKVVVPHTSKLGEGPVWDARQQAILWVDILNGLIHEYAPAREAYRKISLSEMVGAVALLENGDLIAAVQSGFVFIDRASGVIRPISDPEKHLPENRFNDGKCDPAGRFWAGTMALDEHADAGSLYMLDHDLSVSCKIPTVSVSNGLAWSPDQRTFYYIDSPTRQVVAYDFEPKAGTISGRRTIIAIAEGEGFPDGMCIDREGMLWIAQWDGWQVSRWDPNSGQKIGKITLPAARITSCTFGGERLEDLYITSARVGLNEAQLAAQPLAGSLFVVKDVGVRGMAASLFDFEQS